MTTSERDFFYDPDHGLSQEKKYGWFFLICIMLLLGLVGRLWYLMNVRAEYYSKKAEDLHERERDIKAARGKILDIRGKYSGR